MERASENWDPAAGGHLRAIVVVLGDMGKAWPSMASLWFVTVTCHRTSRSRAGLGLGMVVRH